MGSTSWVASQFCLSALLFLVEVVASRFTGSLLLLSCSFHTLGGALTLGLALTEAWLAAREGPSGRNTFGWARARVTGTLVHAVLVSALSLALVPEALRRLAEPRVTEHVLALMAIGAVGIPIHLARAGWQERRCRDPGSRPCCSRTRGAHAHEMEDLLGNESSTTRESWMEEDGLPVEEDVSPMAPPGNAGPWRALCLGWAVACLGPVMIVLYSLTLHLLWTPCLGHTTRLRHCLGTPCGVWESPQHEQAPCWLLYLDPGLAVMVAVTLLILVWPAVRRSALVLLQAVPEGLNLPLLELQLQATEGVVALKELFIWQLDGPESLVATAHVCCLDVATYGAVMERVQKVFRDHGIHISTVEPDFRTRHNGECPQGCGRAPHRRRQAPSSAVITEYETTV
ncbi:proton-coupled zinc antiporter SLC30A1-like [Tiliqua scincoides]|uniref:proton-coupled zinc antiporter SLC30A1-like n=1 Tax=Tiliqua scincoides TaxID=71010 RepID=UPI003462C295